MVFYYGARNKELFERNRLLNADHRIQFFDGEKRGRAALWLISGSSRVKKKVLYAEDGISGLTTYRLYANFDSDDVEVTAVYGTEESSWQLVPST